MNPRHYDLKLLRPWWETIAERPDDRLALGMFADFLAERSHPIAEAIRWAFEKNRRPGSYQNHVGITRWVWCFNGWRPGDCPRLLRHCWLPKWLMVRQASKEQFWAVARYTNCVSAWQNFCTRFVSRMPKIGSVTAFYCEAAAE